MTSLSPPQSSGHVCDGHVLTDSVTLSNMLMHNTDRSADCLKVLALAFLPHHETKSVLKVTRQLSPKPLCYTGSLTASWNFGQILESEMTSDPFCLALHQIWF